MLLARLEICDQFQKNLSWTANQESTLTGGRALKRGETVSYCTTCSLGSLQGEKGSGAIPCLRLAPLSLSMTLRGMSSSKASATIAPHRV
jgi:hypothetical protein